MMMSCNGGAWVWARRRSISARSSGASSGASTWPVGGSNFTQIALITNQPNATGIQTTLISFTSRIGLIASSASTSPADIPSASSTVPPSTAKPRPASRASLNL